MNKFFTLSLFILCLAPLISSAEHSSLVINGHDLYKEHCAKCHGKTGKADTFRGWITGSQDFTESDWDEKLTDEDVIKTIKEGPGRMPAFEKRLSQDEIQSLVQVIRDF